MSARVGAFAKVRQDWQATDAMQPFESDMAMLETSHQIERAVRDLTTLNDILNRVDKNVTAAAKRAVKQTGRSPLRLNSRQAKDKSAF